MKKLFVSILLSVFSLNASAIIIKGEDSRDHFLQVKTVGEGFYFLECKGSLNNPTCDSFYPIPITFSKSEIEDMAYDKELDMYLAAGADVLIVLAAIRAPMVAAQAEIAWAVSAGYSLEGIGATSALVTGISVTPGLASTTMLVDALDPFVHRDLSLSLDAIAGNADFGDLDDLDAEDYGVERVLTIEDVETSQVKKSFTKLLDELIRERGEELPQDIIFGRKDSLKYERIYKHLNFN
ncbi:MAG: hypothetical protein KC478_06775 [Bacteriovoracaceae bacterium]|nr:hypothetical protein [Bacteriovoracaceae bacterium]